MLTVKTYLDKSNIHGIGLFADEYIPKGSIMWEYNPKCDLTFSKKEFEQRIKLGACFGNVLFSHSYFCKHHHKYIYSIDNARFINHSNTSNIFIDKDVAFSNQDISIGDEITNNYNDFCEDYHLI